MAYWCAATNQPATAFLALTTLEHNAFLEVANEITQIRNRQMKKR